MCERIRRRALLAAALSSVGPALATAGLGGCAASPVAPAWATRLRGDAVVLLGEVHDNATLHAARLQLLRQAVQAGWRPVLVMEQFDRERQADLDRARREPPADAQRLIDAAGPPGAGWTWAHYRPVIELALAHDLPLRAGNLSAADARRIVREGAAAVFPPAERTMLDLDRPRDASWQRAHEHEIDVGHCGALPPTLLPAMARAQLARDAVMAAIVRQAADAGRGVVLLAGNGHVRRDLGVPAWWPAPLSARAWVVGYLEGTPDRPGAYDAVVEGTSAPRDDPCKAFRPPPAR